MSRDGFHLDTRGLELLFRRSPEAAGKGAQRALDDIKDDWVRRSRDIAPLDTSNLRRHINGNVEGEGLESAAIITANATSLSRGSNFNYAYYIHEKDAGGKSLKHPGTVKKFLDKSYDEREQVWREWLIEEIEDELRREGW